MSSAGTAADPGSSSSAELALRAAEHEQRVALLSRELAAMADDLRSVERHVAHLEHGRLVLEIEISQLRQRAAELFADLERDETEIAELRRALAAEQRRLGESGAARPLLARRTRRS